MFMFHGHVTCIERPKQQSKVPVIDNVRAKKILSGQSKLILADSYQPDTFASRTNMLPAQLLV